MRPRRIVGSVCAVLVTVTGCDDATSVTWYAAPDTVVLYSLTSPVPNLPNAFDFIYRSRLLVETPDASGTWDVAVGSDAGGFTLLPPGALGISSYAGVWALERASMDDLIVAPSDSAVYVHDAAVPLVVGNAYVIRTRKIDSSSGYTCTYYAKAELVEAELASYRVSLAFDMNPNCNDLGLIPDG